MSDKEKVKLSDAEKQGLKDREALITRKSKELYYLNMELNMLKNEAASVMTGILKDRDVDTAADWTFDGDCIIKEG